MSREHVLTPARAAAHKQFKLNAGWTDEREEELKKLWDRGDTASQIARKLGGVSRMSVIGKARRLGLKARDPAAATSLSRAAQRTTEARAPKAPPVSRDARHQNGTNLRTPIVTRPLPEPIAAADDVARVRLFDLGPGMCKWPIGDPRSASFGFCGEHAPAGPYCPGHHARAHTAPAPKAPKNGNELMRALRRWM